MGKQIYVLNLNGKECVTSQNKPRADLLVINADKLHIHRVDGSEDVGRPLRHAFSRLRHGNRCAGGHEYGLVSTAEREVGEVVSPNQHHLREGAHGVRYGALLSYCYH